MSALGVPEQIAVLLVATAIMLPWIRIFSKAGYSPWLGITILVPVVNFIVIVWFALSDWPALNSLRDRSEDA
jgi:hypothetical protein